MFSQLNKDGEIGIRFSKEDQKPLIQELNSDYFRSYGAVMQGYVVMPESVIQDTAQLVKYLNLGHEYVLSPEPK